VLRSNLGQNYRERFVSEADLLTCGFGMEVWQQFADDGLYDRGWDSTKSLNNYEIRHRLGRFHSLR
jgi:hypothetical protein